MRNDEQEQRDEDLNVGIRARNGNGRLREKKRERREREKWEGGGTEGYARESTNVVVRTASSIHARVTTEEEEKEHQLTTASFRSITNASHATTRPRSVW